MKSQTGPSRTVVRRFGLGFCWLLAVSLLSGPVTAGAPDTPPGTLPLRNGLDPDQRLTAHLANTNLDRALLMYAELTGRRRLPVTNGVSRSLDEMSGGRLSRWHLLHPGPLPDSGLTFHGDGFYSAAEVKTHLENIFKSNQVAIIPSGRHGFRAVRLIDMGVTNGDHALAVKRFLEQARDRRLKHYSLVLLLAVLVGTAALHVGRSGWFSSCRRRKSPITIQP